METRGGKIAAAAAAAAAAGVVAAAVEFEHAVPAAGWPVADVVADIALAVDTVAGVAVAAVVDIGASTQS